MSVINQKTILLLLLGLLLTPSLTWGWGQNGHRIIAQIADNHLNAQAKKEIKKILGTQSMAAVSTWADEIKSDPIWKGVANPWHYVNFSNGDKYIEKKRSKKGDVIFALKRFERVLRNSKTKKSERLEALKFFIHLFADLHQPMHVGFAKDRGGNKIKVKWFKDSATLHSVWDTWMIQYQNLSYSEYVQFLDHYTKSEMKEWQQGDYTLWAQESRKLIRKIYQDKDQVKLGYDYNFKYKPIMELRLRQAGVRMASKLNGIFGN
jgi:hypothetical protein